MSEKDKDDLRFALRLSVDMVALSFVRFASDVEDVRAIMAEEGVMLPVIAKIEKPQAIENLREIIKAFDGFMVARGDLGVECPLEDVPFLQKQVIELAPLETRLVPVSYATAKDVQPRVQEVMSGRGTVSVDERTNVLIVRDIVDNLDDVEELVRTLDTQTPQVLVEARIYYYYSSN